MPWQYETFRTQGAVKDFLNENKIEPGSFNVLYYANAREDENSFAVFYYEK